MTSSASSAIRMMLLVAIVLPMTVFFGCGSTPRVRTTFLGSIDLVEMTDTLAQRFAADDVITNRTADDPPWVISIDRISNQTNQVIPENERWLYAARLRSRLMETSLSQERNLIWVIPPERWPIVEPELGPQPPQLRLRPTHVLTGEFHALTITSGGGRSDAYLCLYQLLDPMSGNLVWEGRWEVKRSVVGLTYD